MIRAKISLNYIHNNLYALLFASRAYPTNFWTTLYVLIDVVSKLQWPKPIVCRPNDTSSISLLVQYKCSRIYNSFRLQFFQFFPNASCLFLLHLVSHFFSRNSSNYSCFLSCVPCYCIIFNQFFKISPLFFMSGSD